MGRLGHKAFLHGVAHLSPSGCGRSLRLEARGLFTLRARFLGGKGPGTGFHQVVLWFRTDREGFVTEVVVAHWSLLAPAPVGSLPDEPLRFSLLGEWLGAHEGVGRVWVVPKDPEEAPPFPVRFLPVRPHLVPAPGGLALVLGRVERGRLLGEEVLLLSGRVLCPGAG
ncbi:hypothetical protein [Thermus sp. NMX2.A1]|uniref:hypothetical protein n=1 Tax=Thermus sp. NMX2.A1 TaxID=570924 RepID=UPI0003DBEDD6|nr:hypothetical protein [Thermus sp. NMX2.A1]ETN87624.1 hypothetical protein TNMX_11195 [Thermus sp. NMX2.A1]